MRVFTKENLACMAADHYRSAVERHTGADLSGKEAATYLALVALGTKPTPDQVTKVMGSDDLVTVPLCDECGYGSPVVVELGEVMRPGSQVHLCPTCIRGALLAVSRASSADGRAFGFPPS